MAEKHLYTVTPNESFLKTIEQILDQVARVDGGVLGRAEYDTGRWKFVVTFRKPKKAAKR